MDFFATPESSNCFCNAQNDTDKNNKTVPEHSLRHSRIMDISPFDDFLEIDWATQFSYQSNKLYINEFIDFENFDFDFNLPYLDENLEVEEQKPTILPEKGESVTAETGFSETSEEFGKNGFVSFMKKEKLWENQDMSYAESGFVETSTKHGNEFVNFVKKENEVENQEFPTSLTIPSTSIVIKKKKSCLLGFDEIKEHFDVPISMAAKKMNVGVTILKRRCRELNINRWPHRKLKSLMLLIDNLKEMGMENEVAMLEKEKKMLEKIPGMELNAEIKKLRQSCFKANYKKRKLTTCHP